LQEQRTLTQRVEHKTLMLRWVIFSNIEYAIRKNNEGETTDNSSSVNASNRTLLVSHCFRAPKTGKRAGSRATRDMHTATEILTAEK
jgi:hypothetical protein